MISAIEMVNCTTTNIFRGTAASLPVLNEPFNTLTGSKEDR